MQQNGLYLYQLISYDFDGTKDIIKPISIWVDNPFDIKVRLYPNPASTLINLEIEHSIESVGTVEIFDMVGRIVFAIKDFNQFNETTQRLSLDISGLNSGIYYFKLNLDGLVFTKKNINSKIKRILKFVVMNQYSGVGNYYKSAMINCFVSQMVTSKNQSNILDF